MIGRRLQLTKAQIATYFGPVLAVLVLFAWMGLSQG